MLQAEHLRRTYGAVEALVDASLTLEEEERVAIMGRSGSGKSTLLHLLGLLDTPDEGTLLLDGQDVTALSDRERSKLRAQTVGFVFQAFHLIPNLSVLQNVALPLTYSGQKGAPQECLERVGLGHRLDHRPHELSGGELQRAAIARALVNQPKLILADEPTGNLDSQTEAEILNLLDTLPCTLLIVTHNRDVARRCSRTLTMEDGKL